MADDQNQRPYRGNDMPTRVAAPASDPLAELARLIGQSDPFSEYGRDGNRRAAAPQQPEPAQAWAPEPPPRLAPTAPPAPQHTAPQQYGAQEFVRQPFGSVPLANAADVYPGQNAGYPAASSEAAGFPAPNYDVPGYGAPGYEAHGFPAETEAAGYEHEPFPKSQSPFGAQAGSDEDYYDDAPPNRRRVGILAIAGVFALAVIGTAGAFGYRAIFGSSSSSSPPPVIKAEQAPSKIVPATPAKDAQAGKMITERVNERGQGEKLVPREEKPVAVVTTNAVPAQLPAAAAPQGSGVVGSEPKKIRTIAIKPDQPGEAMPQQAEPAPAPAPAPRVIATTPSRPAPAPVAVPTPAPTPAAAPAPVAAVPAPAPVAAPPPAPAAAPIQLANPQPRTAAPANAPNNAPLSLNPNAPAAARPAAPAVPQRTAAAAAQAAAGGGYAVQVSAQRSEEEAQAAFRSLQGKYPSQLGGRQPFIKRVDLGEKGIYFRAMVGPFGSQSAAAELCTSLKSAGGSCLIQKN